MDDPLITSLVVAGIGMLMLFVALTVLYGLMYLMTALVRDRPTEEIGEQADEAAGGEGTPRRMAAAVAVALARAELEAGGTGAPETEGPASPWWAFHHHRQLTLNMRTRRGR